MLKLICFIAVMFFIHCNCCDRKKDELLSVIMLFRHGDKTPKAEYFDVYRDNPWSNPKLWNHTDQGSVTTMGKKRIYDLGKSIRERYNNFLPSKYSSQHIFVQASDSDRVLISAQIFLAGLFPPKDTDVWNDKLAWQPIPVHTIPDKDDTLIAQRVYCPRFNKLLEKQFAQVEPKALVDVKHISKFTGKEIESLEESYKLYKLLRIVEENGMLLPPWTEKALPILKEKADILCKLYATTPEMVKFKAGPFMYRVISHFDTVMDPSQKAPKMLLFAGHSRTITNVLTALNAYKEQPPYTATILFELKKNCNGTIIVDVYYQPSTYSTITEVIKNMSYDSFKELLAPVAVDPQKWNKDCQGGLFF